MTSSRNMGRPCPSTCLIRSGRTRWRSRGQSLRQSVAAFVQRYNELGLKGLFEIGRGPGRESSLSKAQGRQLLKWIEKGPRSLGYSFNLDGSMMYMTFASLFIAQSYGIHLGYGAQISMLLVLMLTSKGIAGVPRASLVVIAGTLATFKLPEAGLALLLGIDPLLDMGRSATNVVGNSIATAVVDRWED